MKHDKHEEKRKEILEVAFGIWGANQYRNTSLSELASALDMTKQAIYRYFSSKEKLEQSMVERALEVYDVCTSEQLVRMGELDEDEFVRAYINGSIDLIRKYGKYLGFLSHRFRNDVVGPAIARDRMVSFNTLAKEKAGIPPVGMRYLNALVMCEVHARQGKPSAGEEWEAAWKKGFATERINRSPDFDRMLSDASALDYGVFAADPLMNAVFEAVMEEAGDDVPLGKIAKKAGLTKSSLYNYWPSKEAMLSDVLDRQVAVFSGLFSKFVVKYTEPADRLFSYIAFTGSFLRRTPEILNYLQRVMSYGIRPPKDKSIVEKRFIQPLHPILKAGLLDLRGFQPEELLGLVNLASVIEVKHHLVEKSARIRIEQGFKDLYRLITGGIPALRRTI